ncbi:MAG: hypothetical protein J7604_24070 [Sporocytophaga sp.]|uniref:hypothetical protein n=1 Tax=Sporocytophaga sp. TaxID=2231183 RepID=UPI001B14426C|nr:hypothetical protein [Sporocytophaga sp.]MBO9703313.1 hypothetical protein [Sporocytophaga sp.]
MNSFVALWKPGNNDLYWYTGLDGDEFVEKSNALHKKSYRIVSLDVDEELFTAIWKPGTFAQHWERFDSDEIEDRRKFWDKKGFRLAYMVRDDGDVTAVWEPGNTKEFYCYGLDFDEFKALDKKHFDNGLRLNWIAVEDGPEFTAVWRPGNGAQFWYFTSEWEDFVQRNKNHKKNGLRLTCVDKVHEHGHYMGVVRPGNGDEFVDFMSFDAIVEKNKEMKKKGMELKVLRRLFYDDSGPFPDLEGLSH